MEIIVIRHIFYDHREVLEPLEAIWQVLALLQKRTIDIGESAMNLNGILVIIITNRPKSRSRPGYTMVENREYPWTRHQLSSDDDLT